MFNRHNTLFECRWSFSTYLLIIFLMLYSISLLVVMHLSWNIGWKVLFIILFTCHSMTVSVKSVLFKMSSSFTALRSISNNWFIYSSTKQWQPIKLLTSHCVVLSWVVILQFRVEESKRIKTLCLLADNMPMNDFRRLKVYLRYGG
ncbi:hypothetical protein DM558_08795 [Entomomonas moraniae]|uniref:Uncharacterized protein n=1 Tax=Entomomonas moraniae TaxID=2213226 RepID=A0A3S9XEI5_9GAMM|nr:protein YgfX [Entomomonas moraniae]AZS50873.1 hypothetical protein DM558_08795 [Entomomonas moraniae]